MRLHRSERGFGLVELLISAGISAIVLPMAGMILFAVLKDSNTAMNQQSATQQLRNGLFWLNQDTQSGVASLATVSPGAVTLQWTDYSTGSAYVSRFQQVGANLQRTLTVNGSPSTQVIATGLAAGGFTATRSGNTISYALAVANGGATQSQTESTTMRVASLPPTPFPTSSPAPTSTAPPAPPATGTPTATSTPAPTNTPTRTATNTPTPTFSPTATSTHTPSATPTASGCSSGSTGYLSPSANVADSGGWGDGFETNPTGAYASGGGYAVNAWNLGDRHRFYDYGISIPASCVIAGIAVRMDWWVSSTFLSPTMSIDLSWDGGNSWTSQQGATGTTVQQTTIVGGNSDTWGRTWAASDLSDANFRVRVSMTRGLLTTFNLDWIPLEVYYAPAPTPTPTNTSTPTSTPTAVPTATNTPTLTNIPTAVPTATNTPTATPTPACASGDTGYLSPSANAADAGGNGNGFDTNATGAYASGGTYATNNGGNGNRHRFYNYGISIPAGCNTIAGIAVRMDWWVNWTFFSPTMSIDLSWDGGTTWTSQEGASGTTSQQTSIVGGSADTWGRTWAATDLTNANFRVRVTMNGFVTMFNLDWIPVRVYYAP